MLHKRVSVHITWNEHAHKTGRNPQSKFSLNANREAKRGANGKAKEEAKPGHRAPGTKRAPLFGRPSSSHTRAPWHPGSRAPEHQSIKAPGHPGTPAPGGNHFLDGAPHHNPYQIPLRPLHMNLIGEKNKDFVGIQIEKKNRMFKNADH